MKNFPMIFHFYDDVSAFENVRKTPPAKRLTKNQKNKGPSHLANSIVLSKMLTVFFSIHNPPFSALRGFHTSRNESPSRGTRSPNLVLRGLHDLRLISFAALSQVLAPQGSRKGEEEHPHRHTLKTYVEEDRTGSGYMYAEKDGVEGGNERRNGGRVIGEGKWGEAIVTVLDSWKEAILVDRPPL